MKYVGLAALFTVIMCVSFYEVSGGGVWTNPVAEFVHPFAFFALGAYLAHSLIRDLSS